ncbi:SPRY domain-containing protein [Paenibacillus bouchesdurhonensis]|uniref:SPRY domain-containing protein n=1 Tax=Paenibacillus bouchesdurhonensis TaxID=1870990 RepID=UPI000DA6376A|nr:SPRY domain-containing protein [Paenibacillus bouchesdurhonensis]
MAVQTVTWDSITKGTMVTLSNNDLTAYFSNSRSNVRSSIGRTNGKYYIEFTLGAISNGYLSIGICPTINYSNSEFISTRSECIIYNGGVGNIAVSGVIKETRSKFTTGDIVSVLLDLDSGTIEFWKNGIGQAIVSGIDNTKEWVIVSGYESTGNNGTVTANFGATPFIYELPINYKSYDDSQSNIQKILLSSKNKTYSLRSLVYLTETTIPEMTSDISPNGRAFASSVRSPSEAAWKAFDRTESYYSAVNTVGKVGHLGYEFVNPIAIGKYAVRNRASAADTPPKNWTFEGSNDGSSWKILDSRIDQIWGNISEDKNYFVAPEKINNYKMYRLNWTSNNGSVTTCINELKMYEASLTLLSLPDQSEQFFINYGVESPINLTQLAGTKFIKSTFTPYESGRKFTHTIDLSKRRVDKIILE